MGRPFGAFIVAVRDVGARMLSCRQSCIVGTRATSCGCLSSSSSNGDADRLSFPSARRRDFEIELLERQIPALGYSGSASTKRRANPGRRVLEFANSLPDEQLGGSFAHLSRRRPHAMTLPSYLLPLELTCFEYRGRMRAGMTQSHKVVARDARGRAVNIVLKLRDPGTPRGHFGPTSLATELLVAVLA